MESASAWWAAGVLAATAMHPFIAYPLSLAALAKLARRRVQRWCRPAVPLRYALCTFVREDDSAVEKRLAALLQVVSSRTGAELLVFVDRGASQAVEAARKLGPSVQLVIGDRMRGKSHAMNRLVSRTRADVLVFADDAVTPPADLFSRLDAHFADRDIGCVCAAVDPPTSWLASADAAYLRFKTALKRVETACGSAMGADGVLFAVRATLHHPPPDGVLHDMHVSLMVLCTGHRVVQAEDLRVRGTSVRGGRLAFENRRRTAYEAWRVHRLLWPRLRRAGPLIAYQYVSHKLLRWFSLPLLAAAAAMALVGTASSAGSSAALAGIGGLAAAVLLLRWLGRRAAPLGWIHEAVVAASGATIGVWHALRAVLPWPRHVACRDTMGSAPVAERKGPEHAQRKPPGRTGQAHD